MNLEKLFKDIGKAGAKVLFNKEEKSSVHVNIGQMDSGDILKVMVNKLIHEGNYNRAEDLLFEEINKNNSEEIYKIALDFYNKLLERTDEELKACDFTKEEIYQGLEDIKKIYKNN